MFDYIRRNIKLSAKSVFYNIKQYSWFFCAIILIQTFISTMSLAAFNNDSVGLELLNEEYDYHIVLKNINADQYLLLENDTSVKFERNRFFAIKNVVQHGESGSFDLRYDVYIRFNFDPKESYQRFNNHFAKNLELFNAKGNWSEYKTPLFQVEQSQRANAVYFYSFLIAATILSAIFLGVLYSTRTNYFKFTYGIFMSFGGGFKKIYATSFWEMMTVAVTSIIPSSLISYACAKIIYTVTAIPFKANGRAYLISLLLTMIISALALYLPCKRISRKTPISNIIAHDNSNYVSSPRISFEFFKVSIPTKYELASLFRFRKYNIRLALTGAFFSALFVWVSYFSLLYTETLKIDDPELTITFADNTPVEDEENEGEENGENTGNTSSDTVPIETSKPGDAPSVKVEKDTLSDKSDKNEDETTTESQEESTEQAGPPLPNYHYTDNMDTQIRAIEGISCIRRELKVVAADVLSNVLFKPKDVFGHAPLIEHPDEDMYYLAMNSVYYSPYDERDLKYLERFDYSGDLSSVYTDKDTVIVSDSFLNRTQLKVKPGDTILIGLPIRQKRMIASNLTGDALLARQLVAYEFEYTEFKIGAVIHDSPSDENLQIYMSVDDYKKYSGEEELLYRTVDVWLEDGLSVEEADLVQGKIATVIKPFANGGVDSNHADSDEAIEQSKNKFAIYSFTAVVILCIVPVLWIFSQRMFYIKRKDEFTLLEAVGVPSKKIRSILLLDAGILSSAASAIYLAITPLGILFMRNAANRFFSRLGYIRYSEGLPLIPYIAGALVICGCAFISSYLAYRSHVKKEIAKYKINISTINSEFGE